MVMPLRVAEMYCALKGLVDVCREQERYGELVETLGQLAPLTKGMQQTDLLVEQAKIARDMLGRLPQALDVLEEAYRWRR